MNLKAKLYILKNHTLLLLGPSPFEHWFKSYLCITVGSVYFYEFANQSSSSSSVPRAPLPLPRVRDLCRRPIPELLQTTPPSPRPRVTVLLLPPPPPPPLATPRPATSGRRCRAAATHPSGTPVPLAVLSPAHDCLSLSLSSTRPCSHIKSEPNPFCPPAFLFFLLATPSRPPHSLAGIH
jgi:hypothetical protein